MDMVSYRLSLECARHKGSADERERLTKGGKKKEEEAANSAQIKKKEKWRFANKKRAVQRKKGRDRSCHPTLLIHKTFMDETPLGRCGDVHRLQLRKATMHDSIGKQAKGEKESERNDERKEAESGLVMMTASLWSNIRILMYEKQANIPCIYYQERHFHNSEYICGRRPHTLHGNSIREAFTRTA